MQWATLVVNKPTTGGPPCETSLIELHNTSSNPLQKLLAQRHSISQGGSSWRIGEGISHDGSPWCKGKASANGEAPGAKAKASNRVGVDGGIGGP